MQYQHFTVFEREKIQEMLWRKLSLRAIAKELNRSPSSVSREIERNKSPEVGWYTPRAANERALQKCHNRGREERLKNETIRTYVVKHLKLGWSPEQIAGTIRKATGETISHEAIYQYVYAQIRRDGYGYVKPGREDLRQYLPLRRKRRMPKGMRKVRRILKGPLPSIEDRPVDVLLRTSVGDWEDDLVVSRDTPEALKTLNERKSGVVFIARVFDHTMSETNRVIQERMRVLPQSLRRTLTRDRGSENLGYRELEEKLGLRCYFANAHHPWERGSNENTNGLIRRYFPKKIDFRTITDEEIRRVEYLLNSRPRKRLGFKTPYEVFYQLTGVALQG
jgi:IS30 family transposase